MSKTLDAKQNRKKKGDQVKKARILSVTMQYKLAVAVLVIMLAFLALIIKIYTLQKSKEVEYNKKILSQQRYDSQNIPFRRGDIMDRNGTYLATSEKVYNLVLDPYQINQDPDKYREATISFLVDNFGYSREKLENALTKHADSQYHPYTMGMDYDTKVAMETKMEEVNKEYASAKGGQRVAGFWFEEEYKRNYPYNTLGCNVIGFSSKGGTDGVGGIEQFYNSSLTGTQGRRCGYLNEESTLERVIKPPINGQTVVSTMDLTIQQIVERHIGEWQAQVGAEMTAVLIMNPNNGEILALATSKTFDLNNPRDLTGLLSEEELQGENRQELISNALSSRWRNYAVSDTFEPGSPAKVLTVASALEEGAINGSETYNCQGFEEIAGEKIRCVNRRGHGVLTVQEGIMESCNVVMMDIARAMGAEKFYKYQRVFGLGSKTGIDLPAEAETAALIHGAKSSVPADLATNSFGQNFNATMVQMAAAYSSVVNGGNYYQPHVVKQILNEDGSAASNIEPTLVRETISEHTANYMNEALRRTVAEGTGSGAQVPGYEIGGKTGTAQKYPRGSRNYVVSFIGSVPAVHPEVVCYVVIDTPHVEDQAHSTFASNLFAKIMAEVLPYMNIYSSAEEAAQGEDTQREGISDPATNHMAESAASRAYSQEEVDANRGDPDAIPGEPAGYEAPTAPETAEEETSEVSTQPPEG